MTRRLLPAASRAAHYALLSAAARLVPAARRADWHREWSAELWHVRQHLYSQSPQSADAEREIFAFCFGAFPDAWCLRRRHGAPSIAIHSSALRTLAALAAILVLCMLAARWVPGLRAEQDTTHYSVRPGLIILQSPDEKLAARPLVTEIEFLNWQATQQRFFDGLAFYAADKQRVAVDSRGQFTWRVAYASSSLFQVLGFPMQLTDRDAHSAEDPPAAVLSYNTWIRDFAADPHVAGRMVHIGAQSFRIAGVAPSSSIALPAAPEIWLVGVVPALKETRGYVLALLSPYGQYVATAAGDRFPISINEASDSSLDLVGVRLSGSASGIWSIAGFALFLALLALPAVVSVSMSESSFSSHPPSWHRRIYRWLFLAAKCALIIAIAGFGSMLAAYSWTASYSSGAELAQFAAGFTFTLFGLRWALLDQLQRCPVCLRRVTHPASVGSASQTFLGWNGTEMMCVGGHTLLHVPSLPTSWFSTQRWLYLDTSWEFLFADLSTN